MHHGAKRSRGEDSCGNRLRRHSPHPGGRQCWQAGRAARRSVRECDRGTTISAETVDGKTEVKIPAGTQPEQKLRLRGKGVTKLASGGSSRGDAFISVRVRVPPSVSDKEKELLEQLRRLDKSKRDGHTGGGMFGGFGSK